MSYPNEIDGHSEQTPLLGTAGESAGNSTKASHPVAKTLAGILSWSGSNCETKQKSASDEANSLKSSWQSSTAVGSPAAHTEDQPAAALGSGSGPGSSTDTPAPTGESPAAPPRGIVSTPSWGVPAGLEPRDAGDENVLLFRQAVGIIIPDPDSDAADPEAGSVDHSRKLATGIYGRILKERRTKSIQYTVLNILVNTSHVVQILVGASLTALGSDATTHKTTITALGATNTILAGIFALLKGQGLPDRLHKDAIEYRRVQDWIEETDALVVSGVVGRDRKEIGLLIETAFKKYNAVQASEENNKPGNYVQQQPEVTRSYGKSNFTSGPETSSPVPVGISSSRLGLQRAAVHADTSDSGDDYLRDGNSVVRLDLPSLH